VALVERKMNLAYTIDAGGLQESERLVRYQFDDHLGSSVLELDVLGATITFEEYYPHGGTSFTAGRVDSELIKKRYRFSGKETDEETSLVYFGKRFFIRFIFRWASCDQKLAIDSTNLFQYAASNPIKYIDPTGEKLQLIGTEKEIAALIKARETGTGSKLLVEWSGTNNDNVRTATILGFVAREAVEYRYQQQQSNMRTLIESEETIVSRFIRQTPGKVDFVDTRGGAYYDPSTKTLAFSDSWLFGEWDRKATSASSAWGGTVTMRRGNPSYEYTVNEPLHDNKIGYYLTLGRVDSFKATRSRDIELWESVIHEDVHAVRDLQDYVFDKTTIRSEETLAIREVNMLRYHLGLPLREPPIGSPLPNTFKTESKPESKRLDNSQRKFPIMYE